MKYILLLTLALNVHAAELTFENKQDGSMVINVPKEIVEQCQKEGGCILISYQNVERVISNAARHMCGKEI